MLRYFLLSKLPGYTESTIFQQDSARRAMLIKQDNILAQSFLDDGVTPNFQFPVDHPFFSLPFRKHPVYVSSLP